MLQYIRFDDAIKMIRELESRFILHKDQPHGRIPSHYDPPGRLGIHLTFQDLCEGEALRRPGLHSIRNNNISEGTAHQDDQEYQEQDPPKLLKRTIYGVIQFMETGPYGNWVPKNASCNSDDIKYSDNNIGRIAVVITIEAHPLIAASLDVIDDAFIEYLEQNCGPVVK